MLCGLHLKTAKTYLASPCRIQESSSFQVPQKSYGNRPQLLSGVESAGHREGHGEEGGKQTSQAQHRLMLAEGMPVSFTQIHFAEIPTHIRFPNSLLYVPDSECF